MTHHHENDAHAAGPSVQPDWSAHASHLASAGEIQRGIDLATFSWLAGLVLPVMTVLDLGAGTGAQSLALAAAFPHARVIAVETNDALVTRARDSIAASVASDAVPAGAPGERVEVRQGTLPGDLEDLPDAVDLIWLSGVAHHLDDAPGVLARVVERLRPGGVLALREGGLPGRYLPDGPDHALLTRLTATQVTQAARHGNTMGVVAPSRPWPTLMRDLGLGDVTSRSFLLDRPAPLSDSERRHVAGRIAMDRDFVGASLSDDDRARLDVLLDPAHEDALVRRAELFVLSASTVFAGRR